MLPTSAESAALQRSSCSPNPKYFRGLEITLQMESKQLLVLYLMSFREGKKKVEDTQQTIHCGTKARWATLAFELHPSILSKLPGSFLT